jgi:hypothetical protein
MDGPVELYLERDHAFKKKPRDPVTGKKRIGCAVCGAGKLRRQHLGGPPTLNERQKINDMAYQRLKMAWEDTFCDLIRAAGIPPCDAVHVEAQIGFPRRQACDEGNLRWMVEKALGDALQRENVLSSDTFYPVRRYTMGNLEGVHSPGRSWLRLLIFQTTATIAPNGASGAIFS